MLIIPTAADVMCVFVDASTTGVGGILCVSREDTWMPAAFYSRQLQSREAKLSATELEALALLATVEHFSYYLSGREFVAYTDHVALTHLMDKIPHTNKLHRWKERISLFDIQIVYLPGSKNILADALSRQECHSHNNSSSYTNRSSHNLPFLHAESFQIHTEHA